MSDPLFADPIAIPDRGTAPMTSTFYSRITGGVEPFNITWDFDDGSSTSKKRDTYFTFTDPGFYNVKLTVVDATAAVFETYVAVDVAGLGYAIHRPLITSPLVVAATVGEAFGYQIVASFSPTSFGAIGLPASLTLNSSTGAITGEVDAESITSVTITATNAGGTDTKVLTLVAVACSGGGPLPAPTITGGAFSRGEGSSFTYNAPALNSTNAWSWTTTLLPFGLLFNTVTGVFSSVGNVADAVYPITVTVHNSTGSASAVFTITITSAPT